MTGHRIVRVQQRHALLCLAAKGAIELRERPDGSTVYVYADSGEPITPQRYVELTPLFQEKWVALQHVKFRIRALSLTIAGQIEHERWDYTYPSFALGMHGGSVQVSAGFPVAD